MLIPASQQIDRSVVVDVVVRVFLRIGAEMVVASHVMVVVKTIAGLAMAYQRAEWSWMIIVGERVLTRHGFPVLPHRWRFDLFDHE